MLSKINEKIFYQQNMDILRPFLQSITEIYSSWLLKSIKPCIICHPLCLKYSETVITVITAFGNNVVLVPNRPRSTSYGVFHI